MMHGFKYEHEEELYGDEFESGKAHLHLTPTHKHRKQVTARCKILIQTNGEVMSNRGEGFGMYQMDDNWLGVEGRSG